MKIPTSASLVALAALSSTGMAVPAPAGEGQQQVVQPSEPNFSPRSPSIEQFGQFSESPRRSPRNAPAVRTGSGSRRSISA